MAAAAADHNDTTILAMQHSSCLANPAMKTKPTCDKSTNHEGCLTPARRVVGGARHNSSEE